MTIILASASPRRQVLVTRLGLGARIIPSLIDEEALTAQLGAAISPEALVRRLAAAKALQVARLNPEALVIGCDTLVHSTGQVLGKPDNEGHARTMLRMLRGKWHEVVSAIAVVRFQPALQRSLVDTAKVKLASLTDEEVDTYVASRESLDKAGSYAIQGRGARIVEEFKGDFFTIAGLPLRKLVLLLRDCGYTQPEWETRMEQIYEDPARAFVDV